MAWILSAKYTTQLKIGAQELYLVNRPPGGGFTVWWEAYI